MSEYISRDPIIKLQPLINQEIQINFLGGRQVQGVLKGFDHLNNIVIDKTTEFLRGRALHLFFYLSDPKDFYRTTEKKRELGLLIVKGSSV